MLRTVTICALDRLLSALRDLYSRLPEMYFRQPWELQWTLYALNYTDELEDEADIAAAVKVVRRESRRWRPAGSFATIPLSLPPPTACNELGGA